MPCLALIATPIRSSDDLEEMTVGVLEIYSAATVVTVNFAGVALARVGPILESLPADTGKDLIKVVFAYQKGIVLRANLAVVLVEVEGDTVVELDDQHRSESGGTWQAQDFREKCRRFLFIAAPDNSVV
jgi:hypothetical protein